MRARAKHNEQRAKKTQPNRATTRTTNNHDHPKEKLKNNTRDKKNTNKFFMHSAGYAKWNLHDIKQHIMGIVLAGEHAYAVGRPTSYDPKDESELWVLSTGDGQKLQAITLEGIPVYDGLSAVGEKLYVATEDGTLSCYGK